MLFNKTMSNCVTDIVGMFGITSLIVCLLIWSSIVDCAKKPNIVFILADDYGFNDIGYHAINHGSDMKTPFLDSLAMAGVRLENYYVQPICTPSRSQLMSGRYQIHTGLQHGIIWPSQPNGLPLDNIILPEQLKNCDYSTHMIGKWHLGFYKDAYLPWKRGFDTYTGYLTGSEDYYTRRRCNSVLCGYDFDSENGPTNETYGEYSAHLFAKKAEEVIDKHNSSKPMFLYLAFQSVHAPMQVPDSYIKPFAHIKHKRRRIYAGMVAAMDEAIKNVTQRLQAAGMWDNTLFVFSTDNGGQTRFGGNNWPLRGRKATLWEGGIRGVGFVHGKMLNVPNPNIVPNTQLIHISDWYPTILSAVQCSMMPGTQSLDGYDQWKTISHYSESPRKEILHNIDPISYERHKYTNVRKFHTEIRSGFNTSIHAGIRSGDWKLLTGKQGFDEWVKPPESKNSQNRHHMTNDLKREDDPNLQKYESGPVHLFNIRADPFERLEVSKLYPEVVDKLLSRLAYHQSTAVSVRFPPDDAKADPESHGGFWQPWIK